jgi:putative transcriptional regulator
MATLRGKLLVAAPKLVDPNFYRAVLLMVQHADEGAMGLVLNRPTQTALRQAWAEAEGGDCSADVLLYQGGPCEGPLMLLHTHEPAGQIELGDGLYFSAEEDHVRWLVEGDGGPIKAFVGYAGWSPGQLEEEIAQGAWLVVESDLQTLVSADPDWEDLIRRLIPGMIEVKIMPQDPRLN